MKGNGNEEGYRNCTVVFKTTIIEVFMGASRKVTSGKSLTKHEQENKIYKKYVHT
jgi:hypothetical protein